MKTKIKYKGDPSIQRKKELRAKEGMEASIQTGSWFFRLGQEVGMNSLRSREGDCLLIMEVMTFDPGMRCLLRPSMLMGSIQRRCLLRSGMLYLQKYVSEIKCRGLGIEPQALRSCVCWVSSGYVCSKY